MIFSGYKQKINVTTDPLPDNTPSPTLVSYKDHELYGKYIFMVLESLSEQYLFSN